MIVIESDICTRWKGRMVEVQSLDTAYGLIWFELVKN